jgi:hypothetical protein
MAKILGTVLLNVVQLARCGDAVNGTMSKMGHVALIHVKCGLTSNSTNTKQNDIMRDVRLPSRCKLELRFS